MLGRRADIAREGSKRYTTADGIVLLVTQSKSVSYRNQNIRVRRRSNTGEAPSNRMEAPTPYPNLEARAAGCWKKLKNGRLHRPRRALAGAQPATRHRRMSRADLPETGFEPRGSCATA